MSDSSSSEPVISFEGAVDSLQRIVADLEEGQLGLEESLARFEQGIGLLKNCYRILEQAEQKIELLVKMEPDGREVSTTFDSSATFDAPAATRKPTRRKSAKSEPNPAESQSSALPAAPAPDSNDPDSANRPSLF